MKAKRFPQLLAEIQQLLKTLLHHLLSPGDVLRRGSFMFPDGGRALGLIKLHLGNDESQ